MLEIQLSPASKSPSAQRMASLNELIERLRRVIKEREAALHATKLVLSRLERMATDFPPDALDILEKALTEDGTIERSIELLEPKRPRGVLAPREVAMAIRDVLLECGRPMKRGEIVRELEKRGVPLTGADKNKNVGTIIWRHPKAFIRVGEHGYWLKDVPIPQVLPPEK